MSDQPSNRQHSLRGGGGGAVLIRRQSSNSLGGTSGVSATSLAQLVGDIAIDDADVAQNHGIGCAPLRGRESHTADLDAFDRYVYIMQTERDLLSQEEEDAQAATASSHMDDDDGNGLDGAQANGDDGDEEKGDHGDEEGAEGGGGDMNDDASASASRTTPFNTSFWEHVRSILSNAKPVGFDELDDPDAVIPKGPDEANAFLQKAVGIGPLNPIEPTALAKGGGFTEEEVLTELLYATRAGAVRMQFAPECDRCGSIVTARNRLGDLPARAACEGCNYPNDINSMDRIKVLFLFNSDILYVLMDNFACTPSQESFAKTQIFATVPATSTGSGFRYSVGIGEGKELRPALEPGKYRMHCPVAKTDNYLVVEREAKKDEEPHCCKLKVSDIMCNAPTFPRKGPIDIAGTAAEHRSQLKTLRVPHGKLHFDVYPDTRSFFVLWVQEDCEDDTLMRLPEEERSSYTKATSVIHNRAFNKLFSDQIVSANPDAMLSIQNVVLVFTDVVGSTDLYASMGDGPALQLIRKHFRVLFGAFTQRGRVVKTVGDAVMASFTTGRAAMEAVADALRLLPLECKLPDGSPLQIRVGIHCGPAIVVPVNGVNDFFGQTVNVAARVEAAAKASECFITEDVLKSDPDSRNAYYEIVSSSYNRRGSGRSDVNSGIGKQVFSSTPETELHLKGVKGAVRARGFRLNKRPRRASDMMGGAGPTRTYRKSELFERLSISASDMSLGDDDEQSNHSAGSSSASAPLSTGQRRMSKRASTLGDVQEEGTNPFDTDESNSEYSDEEKFAIK